MPKRNGASSTFDHDTELPALSEFVRDVKEKQCYFDLPGQTSCVSCNAGFFVPSIEETVCQACKPGFPNDQEEANLCFRDRFLVRQESLSAETELLSRGLTALCSTDASFRQSISRDEVPQVFTESSECLRSCRCVLVATKHAAGAPVKAQLTNAGVCCPVVFLQNGLRVREELGAVAFEVVESVVSFIVVRDRVVSTVTMSQTMDTAVPVLDGKCPSSKSIPASLVRTPITTKVDEDFRAVQCGKLLINMTNAVNALSGVGIGPMLMERGIVYQMSALAAQLLEVNTHLNFWNSLDVAAPGDSSSAIKPKVSAVCPSAITWAPGASPSRCSSSVSSTLFSHYMSWSRRLWFSEFCMSVVRWFVSSRTESHGSGCRSDHWCGVWDSGQVVVGCSSWKDRCG